MKLSRGIICCLFGLSLHTASAWAQCSGAGANAYQQIIDRNVFGLRVVERPEVVPPPVAPPKVNLIGIATVLAGKRAIFKVVFPAGTAPHGVEQCFMLAEGQREEGIELIKIDESTGSVVLKHMGELKTVAFEPRVPPAFAESADRTGQRK